MELALERSSNRLCASQTKRKRRNRKNRRAEVQSADDAKAEFDHMLFDLLEEKVDR